MIIKISHANQEYSVDTSTAIDISIPYNFNGKQPRFYDVKKGTSTPLKIGSKLWSVSDGASCNVPEISLNIHCTGTHTEGVGHLLKNTGDIGKLLLEGFLPSVLISVNTVLFGNCNDNYHCLVKDNEPVISADSIKNKFKQWKIKSPKALIIRTIPNKIEKKFLNFNKIITPFFTNDALFFINKIGIDHLIIDLPSVDRMSDDGILGNHRIFWKDSHNKINHYSKKTITELAYIPNKVKDGFYFLNIQIPHFVSDAAPSRPLIYKIL